MDGLPLGSDCRPNELVPLYSALNTIFDWKFYEEKFVKWVQTKRCCSWLLFDSVVTLWNCYSSCYAADIHTAVIEFGPTAIFVLFRVYFMRFSLFKDVYYRGFCSHKAVLYQFWPWSTTNFFFFDGPIMDQLPALYEIHGPDDVDAHVALIEKKPNFWAQTTSRLRSLVERRWIEPLATHTKYLNSPDLLLSQRYTVPDGSGAKLVYLLMSLMGQTTREKKKRGYWPTDRRTDTPLDIDYNNLMRAQIYLSKYFGITPNQNCVLYLVSNCATQ